jgi:hypothetical protein
MSSEKNWLIRVRHILDAIRRIDEYTAGMKEDDFRRDQRTVDAVVRNFLVIGEAAGQVPAPIRQRYPEVPWSLMQGMRHVLVHDYDMIREDIVWRTLKQNLPSLVAPLERILQENSQAGNQQGLAGGAGA